MSIGESIMQAAVREYFGPNEEFVNNDRTVPCLNNHEFDCYSARQKLAFEYQGIQHYEFVPHFHNNSIEKFVKQIGRDQFKAMAATENDITLIEVPYTVPRDDIRAFVRRELDLLGYAAVSAPSPYKEFIDAVKRDGTRVAMMLARARDIAISHGGVCLSTEYFDCHEPLIFRCKEDHKFNAALADVNHMKHDRPRFCPECGGTRRRTFEENRDDVAASGYTLISQHTEITGDAAPRKNTAFRVECPDCKKRYRVLRSNFLPLLENGKPQSECISCARHRTGQAFGYAIRDQRCAVFGIECVNPYDKRGNYEEWRCLRAGHRFTAIWNSLISRGDEKCGECKDLDRCAVMAATLAAKQAAAAEALKAKQATMTRRNPKLVAYRAAAAAKLVEKQAADAARLIETQAANRVAAAAKLAAKQAARRATLLAAPPKVRAPPKKRAPKKDAA